MKTMYKQSAIALLILAAGYNTAIADPVSINITGNVIASPCTVDTAGSTLNVDLGNIPLTDFATAGSYGGTAKAFTVALKDCPASTTKVTAAFSGTAYSGDANLFANSTGTGRATNLGVKIKPSGVAWTTTTVKPGGTMQANVAASTHTASFAFDTRAYSATGNVTPGTISSTMQIDFTYQ